MVVTRSRSPLYQLSKPGRLSLTPGVAAVSPNGVLGDARTETPAAGADYLAQATASLIGMIRAWPTTHQRS